MQIDELDIGYYVSIAILVFIMSMIFYYLFFYNKQTISEKFEVRHKNKVEDFKAKVQTLENKINNLINDELFETPCPNIDKERELFELYYKGVPDTYDLRGNLIRGVEPDSQKAIYYLQLIISSIHGTEHDILRLARIYHYGMHKFERNLDKAEEIYNSLKFNNITIETRGTIKEALADIQKIRVYTWLNLPLERPTINPDINPAINPAINPDINPAINPANIPQRHVPVRIDRVPVVQPIPGYPLRQHDDTPVVDKKNYNDPQNTHNPQVLSTIRHSLDKLKNTPITKNQGVSATEIRAYIQGLEDSDKKQDALRSLRVIENNPDKLSSTDMTEIDALTLVWNRINDSSRFNTEVTNNLKETLFDELASMQEFGTTICSTGRFTHIVDTLNGVDDEVSIKPTYAINEEMMTKSAKIREDLLNAVPEQERTQLEGGTSPIQEEFDKNLKKTIMTKLKEDYVDTGILTESKFNTEVGKWIDHI
jgi:hypothetical protein